MRVFVVLLSAVSIYLNILSPLPSLGWPDQGRHSGFSLCGCEWRHIIAVAMNITTKRLIVHEAESTHKNHHKHPLEIRSTRKKNWNKRLTKHLGNLKKTLVKLQVISRWPRARQCRGPVRMVLINKGVSPLVRIPAVTVSITTIFTSHSTSTGEDCLVLFTMAACLSGNSEHHTSNRICQRHSPSFRRWLLFRCEQAELNRAWRSNDWCQQRQAHCKPFY